MDIRNDSTHSLSTVSRARDSCKGSGAGRPGAPLTSRAFVENLKGYVEEAGISHVYLHQTRHTYARIVAGETGSFLEAREALEQENQAATRVYVQHITVEKTGTA